VASKGKIVGIDGCRAGWLAISCERADLDSSWTAEAIRVEVFASVEALWHAHHDASALLIDMPIGLLDDKPRQVEPAARRRLPGRAASVFTVPCRQAVYASSYSKACDINHERLGTRLSIQAWNICAKISQLDRFLQSFPSARENMFESHPELAFAAIQGQPLLHSKKKSAGQAERLLILRQYWPAAVDVYHQALPGWRRNQVQPDDILDAMVLLLTLGGRWETLLQNPQRDERDLAINLVVPVGCASQA